MALLLLFFTLPLVFPTLPQFYVLLLFSLHASLIHAVSIPTCSEAYRHHYRSTRSDGLALASTGSSASRVSKTEDLALYGLAPRPSYMASTRPQQRACEAGTEYNLPAQGNDCAHYTYSMGSTQALETIEQSCTPRLPDKSSTPTLPGKSSTPRLPENANFTAYGRGPNIIYH